MDQLLSGKKVLITRSKEQAKDFSEKLSNVGAIPLVAPLITFKSRVSDENHHVLQKLHDFTWVFFTSANGVKFFFHLLDYWKMDRSVLNQLKIAVIGNKTEKILHSYGFRANFIPTVFEGRIMVNEFLQTFSKKQQILLVCGNLARKEIANGLSAQHVSYRKAIIYDTLLNEEARPLLESYIINEQMDVVTFTSPSTVQAFTTMADEAGIKIDYIKQHSLCTCIGTTTKSKAEQLGFKNILVPDDYTVEGMFDALINYYNVKG